MPYDGKILSRAMARFDEDKQRRTQQFRERQQRLFAGSRSWRISTAACAAP